MVSTCEGLPGGSRDSFNGRVLLLLSCVCIWLLELTVLFLIIIHDIRSNMYGKFLVVLVQTAVHYPE